MRVTLNSISQKTGISIAAISQVLNNHPNAQMLKKETREKILLAIKDMGYHRNENAAMIRTGICRMVALLADFHLLNDNCACVILSGLLEVTAKENFSVKVYDLKNPENAFDEILRYGIEKVIAFTHEKTLQGNIRRFCRDHRLSLCFLQSGGDKEFPMAYTDDRAGVRDAVKLLYSRGHRRIALINPMDNVDFAVQRKNGYLDGLRESGLPIQKRYISQQYDPGDHPEDIRKMLTYPPSVRPTAFVCADDLRALRVENVALRLGIRMPEECAVVGFGNTISGILYVPASTISQPFQEIGRQGFKLVTGKPEKQYEVSPGKYLLPTTFIERESTKYSIGEQKWI